MAITLSRSTHCLKNTSQFAPDCRREERTRERSRGGKPISLERGKAGQLHMRLHSWRQASPLSLSPSAPPSSPSPPSSSRWSPSTSCAMVRFADCRRRRREWILRHSPRARRPTARPGCRPLSEMTREREQSIGGHAIRC